MSIHGTVVIDLRDCDGDHIRQRCGAIFYAPPGARVELWVGALRVDPAGVDVLRQRADLHDIEVKGSGNAVGRWVAALRNREVLL